MEEERQEGQISRRRMLKRVGAGAAVAWAAPVLTSLSSPAFAQYGACRNCEPGGSCANQPDCAPPGSGEFCGCDWTPEGDCFCIDHGSCGAACGSSADCTITGQRCAFSCCGFACQYPCGDPRNAAHQGGPRTDGK
jgi:hypothetical protein